MPDMKQVVGRRKVLREYTQEVLRRDPVDARKFVAVVEKGTVEEWETFVEMVPLSASDLAQRAIDEAAHLARISQPAPKSTAEVIADLAARITKLEGAGT